MSKNRPLRSQYHQVTNEVGGTTEWDLYEPAVEINGDMRYRFNLGHGARWERPTRTD